MTPFLQTEPENGIGDCFRTALACLLDMPRESVPHFFGDHWPDHAAAKDAVDDFLSGLGLMMLVAPYWHFAPVLESMHEKTGDDCYHLILGQCSTVGHAVVGLNGKLIHDPLPTKEGLTNDSNEWLVAILVMRCTRQLVGLKA